MSRRARAELVMGMPWWVVASRGSRLASLWTRMRSRRRPASRPTTVMSTGSLVCWINPQSVAAERWLTTAPRPTASTAAMNGANGSNEG